MLFYFINSSIKLFSTYIGEAFPCYGSGHLCETTITN